MKQHRGHWNRGTWARKANPVEVVESQLSSRNFPLRNVAKDESSGWTGPARVEDNVSCWDAHTFDVSFFDDNKKVFEWDDSGAIEYLEKAEVKLQQGISSVYADYLNDSEQFSAAIDWDARWSCTLPSCAEDYPYREEKKKSQRGSSTRKELSDSSSAVILGLPEAKDDAGRSGTPSLHLPPDFVPVPTGWDEAEENPAESRLEDTPMQPVTPANLEKVHLEPSSQGRWQTPADAHEVSVTGIGWAEFPSSYQHIIPSGWGDVQADPPVIPSGWGDSNEEPRSDVQMHQVDTGWGDYPSEEPNSSGSGWGNLHPPVQSHEYGNSHPRKQQDFYNKSFKYGYWKPKRGSETNNYESCGRRSIQRPGRPISSMYRVNYDPRPPRVHRMERSKSQWPSVGSLTHGTEPVLGDGLPGQASFLDENTTRYPSYYY